MVLSISPQESAPGTTECEAGCPRSGVDCGEEENFCPAEKRSRISRLYNLSASHNTNWAISAPNNRMVTYEVR